MDNIEIFKVTVEECGGIYKFDLPGWYFWFCLPGCLPDGEPFGPYDTYADAKEAAEEMLSEGVFE